MPPFLGHEGTGEGSCRSFTQASTELRGRLVPWQKSHGRFLRALKGDGNRKGEITSVTSSDVYSVWFPGSTSATESWECWIICMEQIQCSDKPKPMRDTGSSSASHRSQKASPRHPRGQSEPSSSLQFLQSPVTSRVRQ